MSLRTRDDVVAIQQTCPELEGTAGFSTPSDNMGRQGSEFSGRSFITTYLLPRNIHVLVYFVYGAITLIRDSPLINDF